MTAASGTWSTLKPIWVRTRVSSARAVVLPAHGPPVRQILVMGSSVLRALLAFPKNNSSSRRDDYCSIVRSSKLSSFSSDSLMAVARLLRCSFASFEFLLMSSVIVIFFSAVSVGPSFASLLLASNVCPVVKSGVGLTFILKTGLKSYSATTYGSFCLLTTFVCWGMLERCFRSSIFASIYFWFK